MYKRFFIDTLPKLCYPFFRLLLVLSFVCLAINGTTQTIFAASGPGGNVSDPVVRAVDIAEPAVVRIFTTLGGQLTVHFSATNVVTFPQANSTSGTSSGDCTATRGASGWRRPENAPSPRPSLPARSIMRSGGRLKLSPGN